MNGINEFPRILTLLRKERGRSQKEVANELGITQALMSHYEKGKRECGLSFLIKAADYYGVSADYLLGRTAARNGTILGVSEIADVRSSLDKGNSDIGSISAVLTRKMSLNSEDILFDLLKRTGSSRFTTAVCDMLVLFVYKLFRIVYSVSGSTERMFGIGGAGALRQTDAALAAAESRALDEAEAAALTSSVAITTESLERDFGKQAVSLLNLIKAAEMLQRHK